MIGEQKSASKIPIINSKLLKKMQFVFSNFETLPSL